MKQYLIVSVGDLFKLARIGSKNAMPKIFRFQQKNKHWYLLMSEDIPIIAEIDNEEELKRLSISPTPQQQLGAFTGTISIYDCLDGTRFFSD